ncbi:MAG: hypothetical protein QG574_169 [Cyanobacteriota bacterium erpe_2018_sw_21hr_WHONDRS-SW48-000092_B_bin.40]|nr:hypothetical protein [Cyanobacteriota bacterium erpe_2018_sw_21hr_WHONDRS-SW48-000092_B_bin.40]
MSISPPLESPVLSYAPAVSAPPLSTNESWNNFKLPQEFLSNLRAFANPGETQEFNLSPSRAVEPSTALNVEAKSSGKQGDHLLIRGNDQLDAINKHLDAVPLNRVISGDLVVLTGRPGRREQWGIVTAGKDGQLYVHHTDSRYWSKTSLTELAEGSRLLEAYRPQSK